MGSYIHQSMGKPDLGPVSESIAGTFDDREQVCNLRVQDHPVKGSLDVISNAG